MDIDYMDGPGDALLLLFLVFVVIVIVNVEVVVIVIVNVKVVVVVIVIVVVVVVLPVAGNETGDDTGGFCRCARRPRFHSLLSHHSPRMSAARVSLLYPRPGALSRPRGVEVRVAVWQQKWAWG